MKKFLELIESILNEAPLPPEWDKEIFHQSFAKILKYAREKAKRIGAGSSRVAFIIPFEGRETVLKIAKNKKGLAQNFKESGWGYNSMYPDITVPLIDKDEEHEEPVWIHVEKAEKLTPKKFEELTGFKWGTFVNILMRIAERRDGDITINEFDKFVSNLKLHEGEKSIQEIIEGELLYDVENLTADFDLRLGDIMRLANWGVYKDRPVIIDLGFDTEVAKLYNMRR